MTIHACIDAFNLSLEKGSGIATYSRNLLAALEAGGVETSLLHGPQGAVGADVLVDEISSVDLARAGKKMTRMERIFHTWRAQTGLNASWTARTGRIVRPDDGGYQGRHVGDWLSRDVFRTANRCFDRHGRLTPLSFKTGDRPAPDVVHWTSSLPIHAVNAVNIHTIHDLIPAKLPFSTREYKANYVRMLRKIVDRTDHIVVVSEATKSDLIDLLGVDDNRITNTYQTAHLPGSGQSPAEVARALEEVFGVAWKGYFLHYGTIEPKKNLGRLIEAYIRSGVDTPLIIVGATGWLDEPETAVLNAIQTHGAAAERIRRYDFLPATVLGDLVRGAKATLFPSLYEGFGLPVLESMMAGTAVLTSTAGSLPEIAGDAALLVDPNDVKAIAGALRTLAADMAMVEALGQAGLDRAPVFSEGEYRGRLSGMYARLGLTSPGATEV